MPLGAKQSAFVAAYLKHLNATKAAEEAGYSKGTAASQGARLLKNAKVAQALAEAMERRAARVEVKQDDVLRVLLRHLNFDPATLYAESGAMLPIRDMPPDARLAIQSIEWGEYGPKVKLWSKDKALELSMRHLGLLQDKVDVTSKGKALRVNISINRAVKP